ncbi:MAG: M36 family metallopeptidase, partial [Tepidisphaeraceae bacterium]
AMTSGYTTSAGNGNVLALKLVMDALKLQPANPNFFQARDAILQADTNLTGGANQKEIWYAFARRGYGTSAVSVNSTTITEAFDMPVGLSMAPLVTNAKPYETVKLNSLSSMTFQFSKAMNTASFSVASDIVSFTGPTGANLAPQIASSAWTNGNKTLTINFATQIADGTYTMVIGPDITIGGGSDAMDQDRDGTPGEATEDRYTASVIVDTRPGPEGGGYEAANYTFENIDLVAGQAGVVTLLSGQDDTSASIPLGADSFNFYGTNYTGSSQLFVTDNGLISFGSSTTAFANNNLIRSPSQPVILPFWDDWATDSPSVTDQVLYKFDTTNNRLIIEWSSVVNRGDFASIYTSTPATFQAVLTLNTGSNRGDIIFNYPDLQVGTTPNGYANGGSATVGIKAAGAQGSNRLLASLFSFPNTWLGDGKAVRITTTSVSGSAFVDVDGDGIKDGPEASLSGVTLYADANNNSTFDAGEVFAVTDGSGNYILTSAPIGSVNIREVTPSGHVQTNPAAGALSITSGQQVSNVAFGNFPIVYTGTGAADTFSLSLDGTGTKVEIVQGAQTYTAAKTLITGLTFNGLGNDDSLTIDMVNGDPIPIGGVTFDGGTHNTAAGDLLRVLGKSGTDTISATPTTVSTLTGTVMFSNTESIGIDGRGAGDTLSYAQGVAVPTFVIDFIGGNGDDTLGVSSAFQDVENLSLSMGPGSDILNVSGVGFVIDTDTGAGSDLTVNASGDVIFGATQHLAALNVTGSAVVAVAPGGDKLLRVNALSIGASAKVDLNDNDFILDYIGGSQLTAVQALMNSARNGGAWDGNGLTSLSAANNPNSNTTLGAMEASDYQALYSPATPFAGETTDGTAVLVKYTYYGDADFTGTVNLDDYSLIDGGYLLNLTGWLNGDFDGSGGKADLDDYSLIDGAFLTQSGPPL